MNDAQDEVLDSEFRQILYVIKPYITHINSHHNLESYRVWLERLSSAHPKEKLERNQYLLELANQIHDNVLKPPFTYKPPKSLLPPFRNFRQEVAQIQQRPEEISEHFFKKDLGNIQWPYLSPRRSFEKDERLKRTPSPENSNISVQKRKNNKQKNVRPFQHIGKFEDPKSDTSSWCDLTDTTVCGDTDGDESKSPTGDRKNKSNIDNNSKKELGLQHKQEGLKTQEHFVKKYEEDQKSNQSSLDDGSFNIQQFLSDEGKNRRPTEQEVEALKLRMKDLIEVKNALRDTHFLTQDRKKTIENLEKKIDELQQQNGELESLLDEQKQKFMEVDKIKNKEISEFKQKFSKLREREVDYLKQFHKDEITSIEKSYNIKISELETKIESLKKDYEEQIKSLKESNYSLIKQKDSELEQLRSELRMKTSEVSNNNEHNEDQVIHLKRCISKLDKHLRKNEKEYIKRIRRLEHELEVKEMTSQVQLQTQRADVMVRTAAAKQEDVKNAFNSLEAKYKKMMETVQMHALEAKKHDEMVIEELKSILMKNNIMY